MVTAQAQQQLYTHAAEPKAVQQRKAKYREDEGLYPANIMYDRRVVRGNTYAARILPADTSATGTRPRPSLKPKSGKTRVPRTPEPVEGRRHIDIQTDAYLEELTDTVPEVDTYTQTDAFLDRPPTPLFVPQKTGLDADTQIEAGDLFDFDFEVEPILEVLVGKVLEQGLMEVLEEEELAAMRAHQEHFEQIRNAELVATQRMEAAEKRKLEEKERRMAQERERIERERVVRQKVAATTFSRGYLNGIVSSVFDRLQRSGFFYDPVEREVSERFMPWLHDEARSYLSQGILTRQVVKKLVDEAVGKLQETRQEVAEKQASEEAVLSEYAAKEAAAATAAEEFEVETIAQRATFILNELRPAVVTEEQLTAVRDELIAAAEAEAEAKWEAEKAQVTETVKAEAEAALSEQQAAFQAAVEAAVAEGAEPPQTPEEAIGGPYVVVDDLVAAAVEKVEKIPRKEVTDGDILSAMLDKGLITKDAIVHNLAINSMGMDAFVNNYAFGIGPQLPS